MGIFSKEKEETEEEETETYRFDGRVCNFQYKDSENDVVCMLYAQENLCEGKVKCPFWK